jgi:predicted dehydrogenase
VVARHPTWELAGLVDLDAEAVEETAFAVGLDSDECHRSLADALEAGIQADAALVAVPPHVHAPVAIQALEAGLHCLIEKPLADTVAAGREIVSAAKRSRRRAMVSQNYRFKRAPRTVRRLLREGAVGEVGQVQIDFQKDPPFTGFRLEMDEPLITDMAVHHLDQVRGIAGLDPVRLRARSWNPPWSRFKGNASCVIELETASGAQVVYTGSWASRARATTWDGSWEIQGTRGGLRWADNGVELRFASLFDTVFMPGALERDGVMHVQLDQLEHEERAAVLSELAAAIAEDREPETAAADNVRSLALVLGAVESARLGGREIDISDFIDA